MKYVNKLLLYLALYVSIFPLIADNLDYPITIVIPSYNNEKWHIKNLESVIHQNYSNFRILYVNDNSQDSTALLIEEYLKRSGIDYRVMDFEPTSVDISQTVEQFCMQVNREKHFFTLINNKKRAGALANLYRMIHSCKDEEIVATVDGDDWLSHTEVLKLLNETYQSGEIWFTHGTLKEYPWGHVAWCEPVPPHIIEKNAFREFKCPSHMRTFYAWLFKKVKLEDFLYKDDFYPMAWDMAIMYPIAEMAAERHAFIKEPIYIYNMSNPINDNRVDAKLQNDLDAIIRKSPRYKRIE